MEIKGRSTCFAEDVVVERLSRLPVNSLLRFMCVSKEWHALIKSSYFTAVHLQCSDSNLLLFSRKTVDKNSNHMHPILLLRDESTHLSLDLPFMNCPSKQWLEPAGSSSGLVCLNMSDLRVQSNHIVVWNPARKQFRFLPKTDDHDLLGSEFFHDSRDYKVVNILKPGPDNTIRAKVFTRSTKSWREVKSHYFCSSGVFFCGTFSSITLNGVLYSPIWIQERRSHVKTVLSFNLHDEVFNVIPLPESSRKGQMKLLSWKNSLAFLGGRHCEPPRDLWVMNEEPSPGTKQITWVKQFIHAFQKKKQFIHEPSAVPGYIIGSWKEYLFGENNSDEMQCYDPASQKSTRLPKHHDHRYGLIYEKAINYVESLE